jgi:catechol 2,3-dioxygenase-like lactoylglutathione lyase family enzyme
MSAERTHIVLIGGDLNYAVWSEFSTSTGPPPMQLDHINISGSMDLLEKVRKFYCEVFGLEEGRRPDFPRPGYWLYSGRRAIIHLYQSNEHTPRGVKVPLDHVAFRLNDLDDVEARLRQHGIEYSRSVVPGDSVADRSTQLFLHDPSGTRIELNFPGD